MITIAVDAMGGDNAPHAEVEGSVLAARELGVRVMLVGQPHGVRAELARTAVTSRRSASTSLTTPSGVLASLGFRSSAWACTSTAGSLSA